MARARRHSATFIVAMMTLFVATSVQATVNLSFGLYTSNKPTTMVRQFRPVLDIVEARMAKVLGTPVEIRIQVAKDYEQGIAHLASGKVDFSRFGPASYIEAKRANSGLRILAMERVRGDKVFYGIIAVHADSPIHSVEQLRGTRFAFGNDQSTIGRYLSQLYLRNHGIHAEDLNRFEYLGRHDTVGTAVGAGHFEAGALNEATFAKLVAKGVPIRELARFPNVTKPWIAREGLPERVYAALREVLLEIEDPVITKLLKADGFVPGTDTDFSDIRAAIEMNNKFFEPGPATATASVASSGTDEGSNAAGTDPSPAAEADVPVVAVPANDTAQAGATAAPGAGDPDSEVARTSTRGTAHAGAGDVSTGGEAQSAVAGVSAEGAAQTAVTTAPTDGQGALAGAPSVGGAQSASEGTSAADAARPGAMTAPRAVAPEDAVAAVPGDSGAQSTTGAAATALPVTGTTEGVPGGGEARATVDTASAPGAAAAGIPAAPGADEPQGEVTNAPTGDSIAAEPGQRGAQEPAAAPVASQPAAGAVSPEEETPAARSPAPAVSEAVREVRRPEEFSAVARADVAEPDSTVVAPKR